jgi:hypothetical protein
MCILYKLIIILITGPVLNYDPEHASTRDLFLDKTCVQTVNNHIIRSIYFFYFFFNPTIF